MTLRTHLNQKFWAKADKDDPSRIHLLEHHLADVGACFEALSSLPTIRQRLARAGNREELVEIVVQRLAVLAAMHDVGKINIGFQSKNQTDEDSDLIPFQFRAGHTLDLVPVLTGRDSETCSWFFPSIDWKEISAWDSNEGVTVSALLVASLSHHGKPLPLDCDRSSNPIIWRPRGKLDPRQHLKHVLSLIRNWFPLAFSKGGDPLPDTPEFQHMFLGLCTLADWLGSDETFFPFVSEPDDQYFAKAQDKAANALREIGLEVSHKIMSTTDFGRLFSIQGTPNEMQQAVMQVPEDARLTIIESETGSGKTEAALLRFSRLYELGLVDGLYFALPTRAAATQLHQRICDFCWNLFPDGDQPSPVLAVPGYLRTGAAKGHRLPDFRVWWEDDPDDAATKLRWAAESTKRFLAAQIAVGTVDQAMSAVLQIKHSHMRAACLARSLLIVDEVHASDHYMGVILKALLDAHVTTGGYAILMSATLGSVARQSWISSVFTDQAKTCNPLDEAIREPYPAISVPSVHDNGIRAVNRTGGGKSVQIKVTDGMTDFSQVAHIALDAARQGAKVLVIRNTVEFARHTQLAIEELVQWHHSDVLFSCHGTRTLHHGRFADSDRQLLDRTVEGILGKNRTEGGRIVVGTQTLEQSLDLDADFMITDLCPMDVLLQRIGRLHRHSRSDRPPTLRDPICSIVLPGRPDLSFLLTKGLNGLGPRGFVYKDLRILEATRKLIAEYAESHQPWHIPDMNRKLVELSTHPESLQAITKELGSDWSNHANEVTGVEIADGITANNVLVRRDKSFYQDNHEVVFADVEEKVRTRLGAESFEVIFEAAAASPFSTTVTIPCLSIPSHLMQDSTVGDDPVAIYPVGKGFEFSLGEQRFRYDRLGLDRISQ